jgi:hypothetical protein
MKLIRKFPYVQLLATVAIVSVCALSACTKATGEMYHGFGAASNGRIGPGADIYSFNIAMASVIFDAEGRIVHANVDIYEVATPTYPGESMPFFTGWPGTARVTGESFLEQVGGWKTKRERGASYGMNPNNDWYQQMDWYQNWMVGKTVPELRTWFGRFTSPRNGRPINPASTNEEDIALLAEMTDAEKAMLADVVAGATMSLSDPHGQIIEAIEKAYENRTPTTPAKN